MCAWAVYALYMLYETQRLDSDLSLKPVTITVVTGMDSSL